MRSFSTSRGGGWAGLVALLGLALFRGGLAQENADVPDDHDRANLSGEEILLKVFDRTGGFRWTSRAHWLDEDICTYEGVTCYTAEEDFAGHVRELDLANNNLVGTMPEDVFQLPYLETLILRDNSDLFVTFASMGGAQFLKNLVISGTSTDSLAGIEQAAASLQELHLTSLGLTGPIPSEIFQLTSLRGLFANFNEFSGQLPAAIGDFFFMTDLYLYENNLGGPIPSEIGKLVNLQSLALGDNAWSGSLPVEIEQCTDLRSFAIQRSADNLKGPGLTGNLPALAQMTDLTQVDLGNQAFGGNIPGLFLASISSDKPTQVDLRGNQLNGAIPSDLSSKSSLTLLLADNQISTLTDSFCQQVPQWMGGAVAGIGCNAILCPPGTSAPEGRQTGNDLCQQCASGGAVFGSSSCSGAPATQQFERETLISMFDQMGGPYWKTSTNWLDPSANVCNSWFGVTCNNSGQVIAIRLRNNGLTKTPPADVFRLPALRILDLGENTLDFNFDGIENAQNLQTLDLTQTDLTSLSGFAGLKQTQIRKLSLGSNIINGNLPDDIFDLALLEDLDVSHNSFSGQLSTRIGDLTNLGRLSLFGNSFVGGLPTELGRLIELTELKAGENNFNGNLPTELNNLADLEVLSLHQTTTGGAIGGRLLPFINLQQLTSLQLAGNALTGDLPANFLQNTLRGSDRVEIQLDDNFVTGTVPNDWASRFDNLVLDLTGNRITGFGNDICRQSAWMNGAVGLFGCDAILCPSGKFNEFGRQSNTEGVCRECSEVNVLGAKVCGSSPISPGGEEINVLQELFDSTHGNNWKKSDGWTTSSNYCSWYGIACNVAGRVTKVSLSDNGLTGTPSSSIFGLQWLQELDFGSNQITFSFNGIGSAPTLTKLTLSSTHLNSLNGLEAATNLLELDIDDNDIGGTLPTQFLALTNLERLSASYNNIVGRIPGSISSLKALSELTLFHNRFTGALPASIGTLSNLRILALSENNFDGTIPLAYNELTNLETLAIQREGGTDGSAGNVGVNQGASEDEGAGLSGPLPAFDRLSNLRNVFLGENALSGDIPDNFLAGIDSENADIVVDLTSNRLSGGIPGSLARLDKLTIFLAGNQLTETVPDGICRQTNWMFGQVGSFQCNAILCPPNTKSTFGRQADASSACASCPSGESTPYYGSFDCLTTGEHAASAERSFLEEFYKQTNGDGWRVNDHWLDPDVSICTWHGITCNTDGGESVQSIQLMQNGLTGRVPSSVFQLPNLKELNIAENDADVSFSGIGSAQMLEFLNVDSMGLKSLDGLGQAPALLQLHAADNDFGTGFPADILLLTTIEVLFLSHNAFGTNIPDEGSAWVNLKSFSCENCAFEGFLSPVISLWSNLEHLDLADNEFNGIFPDTIEVLPELTYVDVSKQRAFSNGGISGFLPVFASATKLSQLFLQENDFFGVIPENFLSSSTSTELTVDIRSNRLNGTIPTGLNRYQNANFLLADNQFNAVPSELCSLGWNSQPAGGTDCDFVLCSPGTFNGIGRETSDLPCEVCPPETENPLALFAGATSCVEGESNVLRDIYYLMGGAQWLHNDGWGTHTDHCEWYGVTCHADGAHAGSVQSLDLRGNNLVGGLLPDIWLLTQMIELDLSDNDITVASFEKIGDAAALQSLKLSNNKVLTLTGVGNAIKLENFHCTSCEIGGPIPDELYDLVNLRRLFLNYNQLTGSISSRARFLRGLRELYLFSNNLRGDIPTELGNRFMEVISLGSNRFSGSIPSHWSLMFNLRVLSLEHEAEEDRALIGVRDTGLTGQLPAFVSNRQLRELYLSGNALGGTIPSNFLEAVDDVSATIHVDVSSNFIQGSIPTQLTRFDDLRLIASDNLIDEIPSAICLKSSWMDGLLDPQCDALLCPPGSFNDVGRRTTSENCEPCDHRGMAIYYGSTFCDAIFPETLSGEDILGDFFETAGGQGWKDRSGWLSQSTPVCEWFGISCETNADLEEEVTEISLPSNSLSGRVPAIVFHLTSLRVLNVSGNPIDMSFRDASNAISLEQLDVRDTNIISVEGVGGASNLRVLKMSDNAFYGQEIPGEIFSLVQLTHLDVSRNGHAGELSPKVSQLTDLEVFDASRNDIAGTIPDEWENLPKMRQLDLSDNLLYGELPQSFSTLTALESLSISVRTRAVVGLSGQMPSFAALPNLRNIDLGSNALTGTIPANLLASVDPPSQAITVLLDSNQLHGELPIGLDRFTRLNIDLTDNEIDQIAPGLCEMTLWWGGDVGQHSCAAILCPAGQFNDRGRQDSEDNRCEDCPGEEASPYLGQTKCPSLQKAAAKKILEDLYEATGGANWKRRDNWLTHPDICVWHGITCKDELEVETVNLGSNNLSGRPPKELFELVGLRNLWLFSNPIEFSFEGIEKAETLSNLQLDSIGLSSLDGIGGALVLSYLDVRFNALEGPLSSEFEKLTDLETLLISDNDFFGPLPSFASNRRLSTLKAGGNGFTGPLPSFSIHPNLRRLDVTGNQLNGEIPDDLLAGVDSTKPVLLFLAANKFTGILPGLLARFDDLTIFVSDNEITGIHEDLCEKDKWNGGDVERFGCDAILCPPSTYGPANGRATSESGDCVPCSEADFFGHTICIGSGATREFSAAMSGIIFTVLTLSLFLDTW